MDERWHAHYGELFVQRLELEKATFKDDVCAVLVRIINASRDKMFSAQSKYAALLRGQPAAMTPDDATRVRVAPFRMHEASVGLALQMIKAQAQREYEKLENEATSVQPQRARCLFGGCKMDSAEERVIGCNAIYSDMLSLEARVERRIDELGAQIARGEPLSLPSEELAAEGEDARRAHAAARGSRYIR